MKRISLLSIVFGLLVPSFVLAQVPSTISYQGKLDSAGVPIKSPKNLTFAIYSASTGGTALWTETQTSVPFTSGMFSVKLGSVTAFPATLFTSAGERWLGVTLAGSSEMTPRYQFTSSPFALRALQADGVADNSVTSAKIVDAAVGTADLADNSVTNAKIAAGAVTAAKVADEPGVAQNRASDPNFLISIPSAGTAMLSATLTAPAAGYAFVTARWTYFVNHAYGSMDNLIAKLSTTSGDVVTPSIAVTLVRVPAAWPTDYYYCVPATLTYIFSVGAGATTFYLNMLESTSTGNDYILAPVLSVAYFPTAYTTVSVPSPAPGTSGPDVILNK
jgi:hypothetical protein